MASAAAEHPAAPLPARPSSAPGTAIGRSVHSIFFFSLMARPEGTGPVASLASLASTWAAPWTTTTTLGERRDAWPSCTSCCATAATRRALERMVTLQRVVPERSFRQVADLLKLVATDVATGTPCRSLASMKRNCNKEANENRVPSPQGHEKTSKTR